jgi:hypothetical protein
VFFEPPPDKPDAQPPAPPPWAGPPDSELGTVLPMRAVLAFGSGVAIALTDCVVFSNGFEVGFTVKTKEPIDHGAMGYGPPPRPGQPLPDDLLRIGVQYADGRKGTSIGHGGQQFADYYEAKREGREPEVPQGPMLTLRGGSGGGRSWEQRYWVWPLPPEGNITIACEWPARGVALTTHALDSGEIRRAARTSRKLWD